MAVPRVSTKTSLLSVNFARFRFKPLAKPRSTIGLKARIREDLKAGGTIRAKFSVSITPDGVSVDVNA